MAIKPCTVPAAGKPGFELSDDEMEVGIGIHGEPGTHRESLKKADEIVDMLLEKILADIDYADIFTLFIFEGGDRQFYHFICLTHSCSPSLFYLIHNSIYAQKPQLSLYSSRA